MSNSGVRACFRKGPRENTYRYAASVSFGQRALTVESFKSNMSVLSIMLSRDASTKSSARSPEKVEGFGPTDLKPSWLGSGLRLGLGLGLGLGRVRVRVRVRVRLNLHGHAPLRAPALGLHLQHHHLLQELRRVGVAADELRQLGQLHRHVLTARLVEEVACAWGEGWGQGWGRGQGWG